MAVTEIKTLLYRCDRCDAEFIRTSIDAAPLKYVYYSYYGGYGGGEKIIDVTELCDACYDIIVAKGHGASVEDPIVS